MAATVSLSMRADGKSKNGGFEPGVGSGLEVEYDPLKAKLSIDYSKDDKLGVKLEGEYKLRLVGHDAALGANLGVGADSWKVGDSLELGISKEVSATIEHSYSSKDGTAVSAGIKITF